jgi:hypothetical protein
LKLLGCSVGRFNIARLFRFAANAASTSQIDLSVHRSFANQASKNRRTEKQKTNIRIRAGGAYSIISQSLGLEVGGSVGIPLYLAQTFAITMYIFGFREGWLYIFPEHPALLVDVTVFAVLFAVAFLSARLAFRIQYIILAVIIGALSLGCCQCFLWRDAARSAVVR